MTDDNDARTLLEEPAGPLQVMGLDRLHLSSNPSPGQTPLLSLVLPTYNESQNIEAIVHLLRKHLDERLPNNYELIIVDDDSPDGTWQIARNLARHFPQIEVLRRRQNRGLGTAVARGWQVSKGKILGVMDSDLQHPPQLLPRLIDAIERGADLALASRHIEGGGVSQWNGVRYLLSRGARRIGLAILPHVVGRISDPMSGYFLIRRSAIENVTLRPIGYKILIEVLGRGRVDRIAEIGYVFRSRREGDSKVTWRQFVEYLFHLIRLRRSRTPNSLTQGPFPFTRLV
ncbi:polyprenol monophosphomannose synthase [Synechococcus sp. PCC 7336]|uniref:polyprenol monophosphomannose synthase n=1 Tax=Synechococcus sp. PCC 7336 TaxID=195250 RepID=UPI00034AFA0A|nr:polyprenol monophosphomannose synthase [Synechococcus sp. PCC 7336]